MSVDCRVSFSEWYPVLELVPADWTWHEGLVVSFSEEELQKIDAFLREFNAVQRMLAERFSLEKRRIVEERTLAGCLGARESGASS